jgi:Transglycosylase SLT domain
MKELRQGGAAAILLLALAPSADAQGERTNDGAPRMIARNEAKRVRSRQNLAKVLRDQPQFSIELREIAKRLKTEPAWLLNVMASESLFDPKARNGLPGQTASGLLQFIESTARALGTTTEAIRRMSPLDQLRLVEKYLTPFRGRLNSLADVYMAVFRGFIVEGGSEALAAPLNDSRRERRVYALNRGLDLDGDRRITKGELSAAALSAGGFERASAGVELDPTKPSERRGGSLYAATSSSSDSPNPITPAQATRSIYAR